MAHQVFLSHATEDRKTALQVCAVLESEGIRCWMAPRDVNAGTDYAAAILEAIRTSDLVLLVFSSFADSSPYVLREIERAVNYKRPVLALRIDESAPSASIEYYVNLWQKLDATAGIEQKNDEIIAAVRGALAAPGTAGGARPGGARRTRMLRRWSRPKWWMIGATIVVVVAAAAVGGTWAATHAGGHKASTAVMRSNTWIELDPEGSPSARMVPEMAYDSDTHRLIMFGGGLSPKDANSPSQPMGDTWAYDPAANTWTDLKPSGTVPSARMSHAMAYDPATHRLIMFGGFDGDATRFGDTRAYDPATNTWTELTPGGTPPPARGGCRMVYSPSSGRLIMFGGRSGVDSNDYFNDTWAYDPVKNTWAELTPSGKLPPARACPGMAYDSVGNRLVVFGGFNDKTDLNDTWAYDPATNTWSDLAPEGALPSARNQASLVFDSSSGLMILFGGGLNDTWAYDPMVNSWSDITPEGTLPAARYGQSMVYEPSSGQVVMFGGEINIVEGDLNDTWVYTP